MDFKDILIMSIIEASKIFIPAFTVYVVMERRHCNIIHRIGKSLYQEKLGKETDYYKDYIHKI